MESTTVSCCKKLQGLRLEFKVPASIPIDNYCIYVDKSETCADLKMRQSGRNKFLKNCPPRFRLQIHYKQQII